MSVSVVVDDREPTGVAAALRAHADVASVAVRRLDAGDIVIRDVAFERKTADDYLRSVLDRGGSDLEEQVAKMAAAYDHAYVLVEGHLDELEDRRPGVAGASVRGSMASITARYGTPVIPCGDGDRLVDVAVRFARKHTEEPSARALSTGAVPSRAEPVAKRMYGCIEGVGPGTAAALYDAFPTVEELVAATEEELMTVEGVGPKRAAAIYEAFRSRD
ncbi:DNA-binding protein [Halostella sp. JP-L12]|uniref:ERCC4 domain-containing protein n=1 Tax=Halostella TaxID=1843185 RepID=UPI000EF84F09|nr:MULTISPECIES: ERCC4 domain-containing protein [Halostella]NHN46173.1 DNA-binding protein [Halostella sp. JP-L12]